MAGHAQLKFVMTECSKTQIRLTGLILFSQNIVLNILHCKERNVTDMSHHHLFIVRGKQRRRTLEKGVVRGLLKNYVD